MISVHITWIGSEPNFKYYRSATASVEGITLVNEKSFRRNKRDSRPFVVVEESSDPADYLHEIRDILKRRKYCGADVYVLGKDNTNVNASFEAGAREHINCDVVSHSKFADIASYYSRR